VTTSNLLTVAEVAEHFGCSEWTIRRHMKTGAIKSFSIAPGSRRYITRATVEAFESTSADAATTNPATGEVAEPGQIEAGK